MNELRSSMMGYSTTGYASGMALLRQGPLALIYSFVFLPGFYSLLLVTSVDVIIGQKRKLLIVMSVVAVVLKNYAEGSRMCLTHLVLYLTLLMLIYKRGVLSPKAKKWIKRTVIIIIIGFLVVSNIRFSESEKQWRNSYICILLVRCRCLIIGWNLKKQQEFIRMEWCLCLDF